MYKNHPEDTIVAVSTPIGEGGIGIVRINGRKALKIADTIFLSRDGKRPSRYETYTAHYGHIVRKAQSSKLKAQSAQPKEIIDEVILTVMRAPKSYTKEDIVEINCHGGIQAVKKVLGLVTSLGARLAEPGEFTKRAFLNGRLDLAQAEAVLDIISAKTEQSLKVAVSQLDGEISKTVNKIRDEVIDIASHVEASIDFPDEELEITKEEGLIKKIDVVTNELKKLIDTSDEGIVLREGILAIICGKPNVGKSSLMNLLLKRDRVIVSPIPGTTRDAVEETISLRGIPVRLVDTAGIAKAQDTLERESVEKSKGYLKLADMAILVLDGSTPLDKKDMDLIKLVKDKKKLVAINKCDLKTKIDRNAIKDIFKEEKIIEISVEKKKNIELLEKSIVDMIWNGGYNQGEGAMITNARHKDLLEKALGNILAAREALSAELAAIDLKEAIFNLGLITGRSVSDDILDRIFDKFCIGK